jgi:hypothetical protein
MRHLRAGEAEEAAELRRSGKDDVRGARRYDEGAANTARISAARNRIVGSLLAASAVDNRERIES